MENVYVLSVMFLLVACASQKDGESTTHGTQVLPDFESEEIELVVYKQVRSGTVGDLASKIGTGFHLASQARDEAFARAMASDRPIVLAARG